MAYNEEISRRVADALAHRDDVEARTMMGGICYMVDGKMCMGVMGDALMCRIDGERMAEALEKPGCRPMDFTGRVMKNYVLVDEEGIRRPADFQYWTGLCLDFNPKAKAAKKKR